MAIVKGPAFSIEASGNLGPVCYSKHGSLQIAKSVWTGTQPNTTKQVTQQGLLTTVSQAWGGTLTSNNRQTWHNLAKSIVWRDRLGSPYVPTGYQLYMKWNIRRLVIGLAIMTTAPAAQEWVYVGYLAHTVSVTGGYIAVNLRETAIQVVQSYGVEYYKAGPYNSGGRRAIEGEWRFLFRKVPPGIYVDHGVITDMWYWYRGRAISKFGDVQNWFEEQIQFA